MSNREKVLIFSAPSGAGKSTVVNHLMKKYPYLGFSISATSRKPRGEEQNGREYWFMTSEEFQKRIAKDEFIEYEEVYPGLYYGTLKSEAERIWRENKIAVFDIDVQGGINLKELFRNQGLSVFIMPPSIQVLEKRLSERGTEDAASIKMRVSKATEEIICSEKFDRIIINDNLEQCLKEAELIVEDFYRH